MTYHARDSCKMSNHLPLLPKKIETCADVRPLLREVFRDVDTRTAVTEKLLREQSQKSAFYNEPENLSPECEELRIRKEKLQHEYARKLAIEPQTKDYEVCESEVAANDTGWKDELGIIRRKDLMPGVFENSDQQHCRWVTKSTSESSYTFNTLEEHSEDLDIPVQHLTSPKKDLTIQSISYGQSTRDVPTPQLQAPDLPAEPPFVVSEPTQLTFLNFTVGIQYVLQLRLMNISRYEVRLSIQPPSRQELQLELRGERGMKITSGSALELKVHFRPRDVRSFQDKLCIRVTRGRPLVIPIICFMEPPLLDVAVPNGHPELFSTWGSTMPARNDLLDLGARLLGEVHRVELQLRCSVDYASFYIMSEDAWCSFVIDEKAAKTGNVVVGAFSVGPAWWRGGMRGLAVCHAPSAGLRSVVLRVLSSTAIIRSLTIVADAVLFSSEHITLQAQEKDYDILCEGDPSCLYYVNLGTAFPNQPLSATIHLINHSSVGYSYYWSMRPWNESFLTEDRSESDFYGERTPETESLSLNAEAVDAIRVEPTQGGVAARSSRAVHVCAPRAGAACGTRRLVLMLILTNVPRECVTQEYEHMIISTKEIDENEVPGLCEPFKRTVCELLYTQMEVWWEVVPIRFVLNPPIMQLTHSRRVNSIEVPIEVTQLHGTNSVQAAWAGGALPLLALFPGRSVSTTLRVSLACVCDERSNNIFQLEAMDGEWSAWCVVTTRCNLSRAVLQPRWCWLATTPPAEEVFTELQIHNNTFDTINWRMSVYQWWDAGVVGCSPRGGVCVGCRSRSCACTAVTPINGLLPHAHTDTVTYRCRATPREGCVVNLVRLQHWAPYLPRDEDPARTALVAYRVMEPRCVIRVLSCGTDDSCRCGDCKLDAGGEMDTTGVAVLRPEAALVVGERACYRLRCTNTTPVPTAIHWHTPTQYEKVLKILFSPVKYEVGPYETKTIEMALEARAVSRRRVWVCCADMRHSHTCIYLLIDTAIDGRKVNIEIPVDDGIDEVATIVRSEQEVTIWDSNDIRLCTPEEIFIDHDMNRIKPEVPITSIAESDICPCFESSHSTSFTSLRVSPECSPNTESNISQDVSTKISTYIAPDADVKSDIEVEVAAEMAAESQPDIEIDSVQDAKPDTAPRVRNDPVCLQFRNVAVGTAYTIMMPSSLVDVVYNHHGPRRAPKVPLLSKRNHDHAKIARTLLLLSQSVSQSGTKDRFQFAGECSYVAGPMFDQRSYPVVTEMFGHWNLSVGQCVRTAREPGVCLRVTPERGELPAGRVARCDVTVYADCWGLYTDQLLIRIENMEPIILDIWIEVVGVPLQFAIKPDGGSDQLPILWMSSSDPERQIHVTNTSRSDLYVQTYILKDNENPSDTRPMRLYLRFYDIEPKVISLKEREGYVVSFEEGNIPMPNVKDEPNTGIELFLSDDYGLQEDTVFSAEPNELIIPAGGKASQNVRLNTEMPQSAAAILVMRTQPLQRQGPSWYRPDPVPQRVRLRSEERSRLQLSCSILRVQLSALHLPPDNVTRVRKYFRALNVGEGVFTVDARTEPPWSVYLPGNSQCVSQCVRKSEHLLFQLPPHSNVQVCAEVCLYTSDVWPEVGKDYDTRICSTKDLKFYDLNQVLLGRISLSLSLEVPVIRLQPNHFDFGFVATGDRRKTYFVVTHTGLLWPMEVLVSYEGDTDFKVSPSKLNLAPGCSGRIYVQYISRRSHAEPSGVVQVRAAGAAGRWCRASADLRAAPTNDLARALPPHDYTDDTTLPPI